MEENVNSSPAYKTISHKTSRANTEQANYRLELFAKDNIIKPKKQAKKPGTSYSSKKKIFLKDNSNSHKHHKNISTFSGTANNSIIKPNKKTLIISGNLDSANSRNANQPVVLNPLNPELATNSLNEEKLLTQKKSSDIEPKFMDALKHKAVYKHSKTTISKEKNDFKAALSAVDDKDLHLKILPEDMMFDEYLALSKKIKRKKMKIKLQTPPNETEAQNKTPKKLFRMKRSTPKADGLLNKLFKKKLLDKVSNSKKMKNVFDIGAYIDNQVGAVYKEFHCDIVAVMKRNMKMLKKMSIKTYQTSYKDMKDLEEQEIDIIDDTNFWFQKAEKIFKNVRRDQLKHINKTSLPKILYHKVYNKD